MKSILISIQPQWVEKILNVEKTIEIRKTMPKCDLPAKVYIYCSLGREVGFEKRYCNHHIFRPDKTGFGHLLNGKVVAEFTLNKITKHEKNFIDVNDDVCYSFSITDVKNIGFDIDALSLVDFDNFIEEYGKGKTLYGWHIDNLKIYDRPKELSEFILPNKKNCKTCFLYSDMCNKVCEEIKLHLFRPPQSWCYVEELENE